MSERFCIQTVNLTVEEIERAEHILCSYKGLISTINSISNYSPLLEAMPNIKRLKATLQGNDLPDFAAMYQGQEIDDGVCTITTPSTETIPGALTVEAIGRFVERTFFQWAKKNGLVPKGGWKKEDLLQALDESLMLKLIRGEESVLSHFFLKPNNGRLKTFAAKVEYFQQNNTQQRTERAIR